MVIHNVVMSPTEKQFHSTVLLMALDRPHRNATGICTGVAHRLVGYRGIIPILVSVQPHSAIFTH
jgi:hypothetical protein